MPISSVTIEQLAAQLEPAAALLLAGLPATVPPPVAFDRVALAAWLRGLDDGQQRAVLDHLKPSALTAIARRELDAAPMAVVATAPTPPLATILGEANVDREAVMTGLASLRDSQRRLFVVTGADGAGKSRAAELVRYFVDEHLGPGHRAIAIDLAGLQSLQAVVATFVGELGAAIVVPSFAESNTTPAAWGKIVATAVHHRVRDVLGAAVTPWFVFDHYDRMPPADDSGGSFLSEFALQVVRARLKPSAPRAVFIAYDVPGQVAAFTERLALAPVERDEVRAFLVRRNGLTDAAALARADAVIAQAKAECAQVNDTHETQFMAFLAAAL